MTTFTRSILALGLCFSLGAVACSSDDSDDGSSGGSGGSGGGGKAGSSGPGAQAPDGDNAEAWIDFLKAGEYTKSGWVADVAMPRSGKAPTIHGRVRVFFNEKAKAAQTKTPAVYEKGSVVVKEFFDADKSVGWTAFLKTGATENDEGADWQVFCVGPATRCASDDGDITEDNPLLGTLQEKGSCMSCHHKGANAGSTKLIYTKAPK